MSNGKLVVNGAQSHAGSLTFTGKNSLTITCGDKKKQLRGELQAKIHKGKLLVINVIDIEEYLYSVVSVREPSVLAFGDP